MEIHARGILRLVGRDGKTFGLLCNRRYHAEKSVTTSSETSERLSDLDERFGDNMIGRRRKPEVLVTSGCILRCIKSPLAPSGSAPRQVSGCL
jgi:hypothetical protein